MDRKDYLSDLTMSPELIGLSLTLSPLCAHISSQRSAMFVRNLPQAMIVNGNEVARIQIGRAHV